ncbi:FAD-binding oxidoreductase [Myxococcota bacterium]|nr:FAD-binding oxidoreductase [Myxococcota bacterium]MBU1536684.1 FAD-binding oxidoreductase [Myxococcota bacterium]
MKKKTPPERSPWYETPPPAGSYRALFKWGAPDEYKHPSDRLVALMRETFGLGDGDLAEPPDLGLDLIPDDRPPGLEARHLAWFEELVGEENLGRDTYSRLATSYGKTMIDLLRLRHRIVEHLPDLVVHPRGREDVVAIVAHCHTHRIPVYVFGGGSSVTRGTECVKGGITLDMRTHMNRVLEIGEVNQTVRCEPGIYGPALEAIINSASRTHQTAHDYTCGHFPQSFEFSCVGGWVVTRGAGQNSTSYGKIEHLVLCQEYVTPRDILRTTAHPARATGPDIDQILMGSEGAFGVLVSVTLKIFRHTPDTRQRFSFVFRSWPEALAAYREVMQSECGRPSVFRLSDPEETAVGFKLYGIEGTTIDRIMSVRGYKPQERCLLLGSADGHKRYAKLVAKNVKAVCGRHGAMNATSYGVKMWEHGRYRDPYLRDALGDHGILIDTLECAVNWEQLPDVHTTVGAYLKRRPGTIAMTHISHAYPQGCNLYFIFIARMELGEFIPFHAGLVETIISSGAALSHHHGIGKMLAPWLPRSLGAEGMALLKALKAHFDPHGIMNPGGTLALDLDDGDPPPAP